eukprot:gene304-biopygen279
MLFDFTTSFVSQLLKDTSQGKIVMFTGLYSMSTLMAQITANLAYSSQRLFIASPNQMASETSLNYITLFNSQFSAANSGMSLSATDPIQQLLSVAGWLVGTMAVSIYRGMGVSGLACDPKGLETFLLGPGAVRSWTIGTDYVLGGYSGECAPGSSAAANSGVQLQPGRAHGVAVPSDTGEQRAQVQKDRRGVGELEPVHPSVKVLHGGGRPASATAGDGAGEQRELAGSEWYHGFGGSGEERGGPHGVYPPAQNLALRSNSWSIPSPLLQIIT